MLFYYKENNSNMGENSENKKNTGHYFFMRNPYMKFQNISTYGSKLAMHMKATNGQNLQRQFSKKKIS